MLRQKGLFRKPQLLEAREILLWRRLPAYQHDERRMVIEQFGLPNELLAQALQVRLQIRQ